MVLQDFARQEKRKRIAAENSLYVIEIMEGIGDWVPLPEKHHKFTLALAVVVAEGNSRQCYARIRKVIGDDNKLLLAYWPENARIWGR